MIQRIKYFTRHRAPANLFPVFAMPCFHLRPKRDSAVIEHDGGLWKAKNLRRELSLYYPTSQNTGRIAKVGVEKGDYYQLPGAVEVEATDTVVDVGARVGEFATAVAPTAERVVAIEPDQDSVDCLKRNTSQYNTVIVERALLDSQLGERTIQLGTDPTENSVFGIDAGGERGMLTMKTQTLSTICDRHDIVEIDFLKLAAEGTEPEILKGAEGIPIQKIAAGVGPERNGERTRSIVTELLLEQGFEVKNGTYSSRRQPTTDVVHESVIEADTCSK